MSGRTRAACSRSGHGGGSDIPELLRLLRQLLRAEGLRQVDVARELDVGVATAKRYLAGRGLTLPVLERLCALVGLRLRDLSDLLGRSADEVPRTISFRQEALLAGDRPTALVFYLLRFGWTVPEITAELGIGYERLFPVLRALDAVELIALMPGDRVRLLSRRFPEWQPSGPVRRAITHRDAACLPHVFDMHHGGNAEIGVDAADRATGLWALDYRNIDAQRRTLTLMSTWYHDRYRRVADRWLIAESRCEFRTVFHAGIADGLVPLLYGRSLAEPAVGAAART